MASPPKKYTYDAAVMQADVERNLDTEPAFRTRIINTLNMQNAQNRKNIVLRLPQPSILGHCMTVVYSWTTEEAEEYLAASPDDRVLPRDLTTIDKESTTVKLWIFNAVGTGDKLPELKLDPLPDFERHPALCLFDMDGAGSAALIPSVFLEMKVTGPGRVQFVLKQNRGVID